MYLKKLEIRNIRSFESSSLVFSKGINLLVGANNSGKSSIIKSIERLQSPNSLNQFDIRKTKRSGKTLIDISDISEDEQDFFYSNGKKMQVNHISIATEIHTLNKSDASGIQFILDPIEHFAAITEDNIIIHGQNGNQIGHLDAFSGFPTMENENNFIYPFLAKRKNQYYHSGGTTNDAYNISSDMRTLPARIKKISANTHPANPEFKSLCEEIFGFPIGSVLANSNAQEEKIGIYASSNDMIYLDSMGEGVANIIGLLSILLTEDNKLFLIEEIENDIHPQVLKRLLSVIIDKAKNNQFIISTHSNIVLKYLASVPDSKVFYVSMDVTREDSKGKRLTLPTSTVVEIQNTPENRIDILQQLGYDNFDFDLFKSYIIFEESSAESIIRDYLIPWFVPELHNVVKTIGASGVDSIERFYEDCLRLFVYINGEPMYNKKVWVIADGDPSGVGNIDRLKKRYSNWPEEHFKTFSEPQFEYYYPEVLKNEYKALVEPIKDRSKRYNEKKEFTKKVKRWIEENNEEAKAAFSHSASNVIDILKEIASKLKDK